MQFTKSLKAWCAGVIAVALVLLTGCSGNGADGDELTIGISFPNYSRTPALQVEMKAAEAEAKRQGVRLVLDDPGSDLDRQVSTIKTWIPQGYDAIIAVALDATVLEGVAKEATDAGVKWITYGSTLKNQTGEIDMQQEAGGRVLGELAADWFQTRNGAGKVALLTYEEGEWARDRRAAIEKTLAEKAPNVSIVAQQDAISETEGLDAAKNLLQAHPDLNAILAISESASYGAYGALADKNDPNMFIGGIDGLKEVLEVMRDNPQTAYRGSAALDLQAIGTHMVTTAIAAVNESGPSTYKVTYTPVTPGSSDLDSMLAMWN